MLPVVMEVLPAFERVRICAALVVPTFWLPNATELGDRVTAVVPGPERPTDWGLPPALSVRVTQAVREPVPVGVKVTLIEQFEPAASEVPQVLVSAKSALLAPEMAIELMESEALPVFESVTVCALLVVLTTWLGKVSEVGNRLATGSDPPPPAALNAATKMLAHTLPGKVIPAVAFVWMVLTVSSSAAPIGPPHPLGTAASSMV